MQILKALLFNFILLLLLSAIGMILTPFERSSGEEFSNNRIYYTRVELLDIYWKNALIHIDNSGCKINFNNLALCHKYTKRGSKGIKRKYNTTIRKLPTGLTGSNLIKIQSVKEPGKQLSLPRILYTNCRSLNIWKLAELQVCAEIHQPELICLTETWLDDEKQQTININGYSNYFSNRKNRTGGGVGIMTHEKLSTNFLSAYITPTFSAI